MSYKYQCDKDGCGKEIDKNIYEVITFNSKSETEKELGHFHLDCLPLSVIRKLNIGESITVSRID